ncbi:MAG: hypothetical protein WKG00_23930 [Polyangiaceae bacterium]
MAAKKPPLSERLKALFAEYGQLAIVIYLVIFVVVLAGFALAIRFGVQVDGTAGAAGTLGAAWLATKLTQPLRIAAALALTPVVAALRHRLRGTTPAAPAPTADAAPSADPAPSPAPAPPPVDEAGAPR